MAHGHVLLIGSPWIMRQGLRKLLRRINLSIVAEGDDYDTAFGNLDHTVQPVLILVIVSRVEQFRDGLQAIRRAAIRFFEAKLILLAEGIDEAGILEAALAGANAVLSPRLSSGMPRLSSGMLGSSVQLVLMNQNLFPTPAASSKASIAESTADDPADNLHKAAQDANALERQTDAVPIVALRGPRVVLGPRPEEAHQPSRPPSTLLNLVWNSGEPVVTNSSRPLTPSDREWEILQCLANGGSNKGIARQLGIAETTVKVHVKSLLRKLGVANRTQAAIWALNHGQLAAEPAIAEATCAAPGE